jgi:hypothetical protein
MSIITREKLEFYLDDLVKRYEAVHNGHVVYPYTEPRTVQHFAKQIVEMIEQCGAFEVPGDKIVLETDWAFDSWFPNEFDNMSGLMVLRKTIKREHKYVCELRNVLLDEKPPYNRIWYAETLILIDEPLNKPTKLVRLVRWKTGHMDSSD